MYNNLNNKLQILFQKEIEFSKGIVEDEFNIQQFNHFFSALQQLYFNNLCIGKYNKLFTLVSFGINSTTRFYIDAIEKLRKIREPDYTRELTIEGFLISNFNFFKDAVAETNINESESITLDNIFQPDRYEQLDPQYFKPLIGIYDLLNQEDDVKEHIENFVLTNSLVSLDYVKGYSDIDAILLIKQSAFESPSTLKKVKKLVSRILKKVFIFDPLQHHSLFILNEIDLLHYPQAFYPTVLFEHSVNLINTNSMLTYRYCNDTLEKRLALYKVLKKLLDFVDKPDKEYCNLFELKHFTANITLLPLVYIQLIGNYIYKREAFKVLDEYFENTAVFKKAEDIRLGFPYKRVFKRFPGFMHPTLIPVLHSRIYKHQISKEAHNLKELAGMFLNDFINKIADEKV